MNDYEIQKIRDTAFCSGYNTAVSKYETEIADLKEEINKIAFARGNLEEENAELKTGIALKDEEMGCIETDFNTFKSQAKELLTRFIRKGNGAVAPSWEELITEAEQFLNSEVEK